MTSRGSGEARGMDAVRWTATKKASRRRIIQALALLVALARNPFLDAVLSRWPKAEIEDVAAPVLGAGARTTHGTTILGGNRPVNDEISVGGGECGRILLYATDLITPTTGLGHRTGRFLLAAILAALTDSALVVLDPPQGRKWADVGGSPYGCPREGGGAACHGLPTGLGRIVEVPRWLSRGCKVPCAETHTYRDWYKIAERTRRQSGFATTTCTQGSSGGSSVARRNVTVLALGKFYMNHYWVLYARNNLFNRKSGKVGFHGSDPDWAGWVAKFSQRMGASPTEIARFVDAESRVQPLEYLGALLDRAGGLRYQPWILEDVTKVLRETNVLPQSSAGSTAPSRLLGAPSADVSSGYDAVHVRRGDRVGTGANAKAVSAYWSVRGYPAANFTWDNKKNEEILSELYPTKYVPFSHYWHRYNSSKCPDRNGTATAEGGAPSTGPTVVRRVVYIATDDAEAVRAEIANLTSSHGDGYWTRCGERTEFVFNPRERYAKHIHLSQQTTVQRWANVEDGDKGYEQYLRTASAIADLHVLSQSDIFVGELQSFWGRLLRTLRTSFRQDVPVTKDVLIAWGNDAKTPPW